MGLLDGLTIKNYCDYNGIEYKQPSENEVNIKVCPHCGNSKWKVYINNYSNIGTCHVCKTVYNAYTFAREFTGYDKGKLAAHLKDVRREEKLLIPTYTDYRKAVREYKNLRLPIAKSIGIDIANPNYLKNRGITEHYSKMFDLRVCDSNSIYVCKGSDGEPYEQSYDGRILIPIKNIDGVIVSFQGRDYTGLAEKKYMFPSGVNSASTLLYNIDKAKGCPNVIINEGVFDVIATQIAIDKLAIPDLAVVGSFGKHFSKRTDRLEVSQIEHLNEMKRLGLKTATIMWDGEKDAYNDAIKAAETIHRKIGIKTRVAALPSGKDPNEVIPQDIWKAYLNAVKIDSTFDILKARSSNPY